MTEINILIALLPIIFMIHDFEEIIMFKPWLVKNRFEIKRRFPRLDAFLTKKRIYDLSTSGFAVAVLHEFLLISTVTFLSLWYENLLWWLAAFSAYFIHLLLHIGQWMIWRKYVPVIFTSIVTFPYCLYTLCVFMKTVQFSIETILLWTLIGLIVALCSLPSAFYFALKFDQWRSGIYINK